MEVRGTSTGHGTITLLGAGSSCTVQGNFELGYTNGNGPGSLLIGRGASLECSDQFEMNGAGVTSANVFVWDDGVVRAGTDGSGHLLIYNGEFNLYADAQLPAGTYTPLEAGTVGGLVSGGGDVWGYGVIWDEGADTFTTEEIVDGTGGVTMFAAGGQRLSFDGGDLVVGFAGDASEGGEASFNVVELMPLDVGGELILAASNFSTSMAAETVLISVRVGFGYSRTDFSFWRKSAGWVEFDPEAFDYSGGWLTFPIFGFQNLAVTSANPPNLDPEITVFDDRGRGLGHGNAYSFSSALVGGDVMGGDVIREITIRNDGASDLTGISVAVSGTNGGEFVPVTTGMPTSLGGY